MREAEILRQCLEYLHAAGHFAWRQNQGAFLSEYKGKKRFVRFASAAGITDIIGCIGQGPKRGQLLAVECKRPSEGPTLTQEVFLDLVTAHGGLAVVVHSVEELQEALES